MRLGALARPELIFPDLPAADRPGCCALCGRVAGQGLSAMPRSCSRSFWEREQHGSTGIGAGVAIPHCKLKGCSAESGARLGAAGVDFGGGRRPAGQGLFLVVSPGESPAEHLQVLAAISRWIKADGHAGGSSRLRDAARVYDLLRGEDG